LQALEKIKDTRFANTREKIKNDQAREKRQKT
jgi:hypothetical protein